MRATPFLIAIAVSLLLLYLLLLSHDVRSVVAVGAPDGPTPTNTPTPTATGTATATSTATPTSTPTTTSTVTSTPSNTPTSTSTVTPTSTATLTSTVTPSSTPPTLTATPPPSEPTATAPSSGTPTATSTTGNTPAPTPETLEHYLPIIVIPEIPPTNTPVPPATSTAVPTASSTPVPTSTMAPPAPTATATATLGPQPSGDVVITDIHADGSGGDEPDEYVEIRNEDNYPIQLEGWTLRDIANHIFTFPGFLMQPGQTCRVYTNQVHAQWCGFSYGSGSPVWNNTGDCAYLRNSGGVPVDTYCY